MMASAGSLEDVRIGIDKYKDRKGIAEIALRGGHGKKYKDPPHEPLYKVEELWCWSFYRAGMAEMVATFLFIYVSILTLAGEQRSTGPCVSVGVQGIAWAFGGTIFILVYCTAGISGGHINPAVTLGMLLARKLTATRAALYIIMQCLGAICGAGVVKSFLGEVRYELAGGGANIVREGYSKGSGMAAEIIGTFILLYTVFSATDAKRNARDSHVPALVPLPIGFSVVMVHLATIPITGTGINPARSFGTSLLYNKESSWDDQWVFWVGPFIGAALSALYHEIVMRALPFKKARPGHGI